MADKKKEMLHSTSLKILRDISDYETDNDGWYPVIRDIMHNKSLSHVCYHLDILERDGLVQRRKGRSAIRITEAGKATLKESKLAKD